MKEIHCKYCKSEIALGAKRCPKCQGDLRNWFFKHKILSALCVFVLILIFLSSVGSNISNEVPRVSVGEAGILRLPSSSDDIIVSVSEVALERFIKASIANDRLGVAQMVLNGEGFLVQSGTKILVIDSTTFQRKVRILEGEHFGRSGWVPYEWVITK